MAKKILVIDDEPDVIAFQKAYLSRRKYEVFTASNAEDALAIIKAQSPDIVFCDMRLDGAVSGLDILEQAKQLYPGVIFFLVTGLSDAEIEQKALAFGAREVLVKPVSNETIIKKIEEL